MRDARRYFREPFQEVASGGNSRVWYLTRINRASYEGKLNARPKRQASVGKRLPLPETRSTLRYPDKREKKKQRSVPRPELARITESTRAHILMNCKMKPETGISFETLLSTFTLPPASRITQQTAERYDQATSFQMRIQVIDGCPFR